MAEVTEKSIRIPVYRDLSKGDRTVVGFLELDPKLLPDDPYYSICLVNKRVSEYCYKPLASSIVDDYNLAVALSNQYALGSSIILKLTKGDLA